MPKKRRDMSELIWLTHFLRFPIYKYPNSELLCHLSLGLPPALTPARLTSCGCITVLHPPRYASLLRPLGSMSWHFDSYQQCLNVCARVCVHFHIYCGFPYYVTQCVQHLEAGTSVHDFMYAVQAKKNKTKQNKMLLFKLCCYLEFYFSCSSYPDANERLVLSVQLSAEEGSQSAVHNF